jgi:integrase
VSHADVASWVSSLTSGGLSPASVRYIHRILSLLLALAVLDGPIARNPALGVSLPRDRRREPRFLTPSEVAALVEAAGPNGLSLRVLALTGLRFGELAALRVSRVDLEGRRILVAESVVEIGGRLVWSTPKSHQARLVPLPPSLVEPLWAMCRGKAPSDLVFTAPRGGVLRINNWRPRVFDPACAAAGLTGVSPHDLRHTAASLAVSAGANVKAVQRMLGHAPASMTLDVYAGLFADDLTSACQIQRPVEVRVALRKRGSGLWEWNRRLTHYEGAVKVLKALCQHRQHAPQPPQHFSALAGRSSCPTACPTTLPTPLGRAYRGSRDRSQRAWVSRA